MEPIIAALIVGLSILSVASLAIVAIWEALHPMDDQWSESPLREPKRTEPKP